MSKKTDEQFNFQEPCCIENSLPRLLRSHPFAAWQTNGDVTFEKIMKAVSSMAGNVLRITLVIPQPDLRILRTLAWYVRRGWLKSLTLLTHDDVIGMARGEFPFDFSLACFCHKSVADSLVVIEGEAATVVVQGPLHALPAQSATVERFVTYCGRDDGQVSMLAGTTFSRLSALLRRQKKRAAAEEVATAEEADTAEEDSVEPDAETDGAGDASPAEGGETEVES